MAFQFQSPAALETSMSSPAPITLETSTPARARTPPPVPPRPKKIKSKRPLGMMHSSRPQRNNRNNRNSNLSSIGEFPSMEAISTTPSKAQPASQPPARNTEAVTPASIETISPPSSLESTHSTLKACARIIKSQVYSGSEDERPLMIIPGTIDNDVEQPGSCHHEHEERHRRQLEQKQEPGTWTKYKTRLQDYLHLWAWERDWNAHCSEKKQAKIRKCQAKRQWRELQEAFHAIINGGKMWEKA